MLKIFSTPDAAKVETAIGQIMVIASWNANTKEKIPAKAHAINLPMECLKAPEVPEAFRPLVESALMQSAVDALKKFVNENPAVWEVSETEFTRPQLVELFMQRGSAWMSKTEIEKAFKESATWKRISESDAFKRGDVDYLNRATVFRDNIAKLSAKAFYLPDGQPETYLSNLSAEDLDTPLGQFLTRKLAENIKRNEAARVNVGTL